MFCDTAHPERSHAMRRPLLPLLCPAFVAGCADGLADRPDAAATRAATVDSLSATTP